MKQLNSLNIKCEADKTDALLFHIQRGNVTYAVTAHDNLSAEEAVTAHLASPETATQEPELLLP